MKKQHLLKSMLLLCALVAGSTSVWAQSGPDLTKFTWGEPVVDEDFESTTVNEATAKKASVTNYTAMGEFNAVYNNNTNNKYGIENEVFGSKALFLKMGSTSGMVAAITGKSFGTTGAFSCKIRKTNKGYFGLYDETISGTVNSHAKSSVFFQISNGTLSISGGTGLKWQTVGAYSTDNINVFVIYNNTDGNVTYGNEVSLASKTAHVFVNGSCVMDGASPKAFTIPGAGLQAFRVGLSTTSGNTINLDDLKIYSGLPTIPVTITSAGWASFSNANEIKIPTGVTAYYASASGPSSVTLKAIDGKYIPSSTGVILSGSEDTYYTTVTSTSATLPGSNLLHAQLTEGVPSESTYYTLAAGPTFKLSTGGTLAAGKAYLVPSGSSANELTVDFGEGNVTGITDIKNNMSDVNCVIYDLSGRKVSQPTKGLYIVNGKKVLIK